MNSFGFHFSVPNVIMKQIRIQLFGTFAVHFNPWGCYLKVQMINWLYVIKWADPLNFSRWSEGYFTPQISNMLHSTIKYFLCGEKN